MSKEATVYNLFVAFQEAAREHAIFQEKAATLARIQNAPAYRNPDGVGQRNGQGLGGDCYYSGAYNETRHDFEEQKYEAVIEQGMDRIGGVFLHWVDYELAGWNIPDLS